MNAQMKRLAIIGGLIVCAIAMLAGCGGSVDAPRSSQSPKPVVTISAEPSDIVRGDTVTVRWSTTDAASCVAHGDWHGARATSGSEQLATRDSGKLLFTLSCKGDGGTAENTATVISHRGVSS